MLKSEQKEEQKKEKAKLKKKEKKKKRNKQAKTPPSPSRATTPATMPARSTHETAAFNCTFDYLATAIERTQNEVHSQLTDRSVPSFTKQTAGGDWLEVRSK